MPHPARLTTRTRPGKHALAAAAAALLLTGGISAYLAQHAPPANAQTTVTGGLDASINPGSITVGLATVSATITYTCTDTSAPAGRPRCGSASTRTATTPAAKPESPAGPATSTRPRPSPPSRSA